MTKNTALGARMFARLLICLTLAIAVGNARAQTYVWDSNFNGNWNDATKWAVNNVYGLGFPGSGDNATVNGGTVNLVAGTAVTNLTLTGGTITGNADLTVSGTCNWSGGTLSSTSNLVKLSIPVGATLAVNGGGGIATIDTRTIEIAGTMTYNSSPNGWGFTVTNAAINVLSGGCTGPNFLDTPEATRHPDGSRTWGSAPDPGILKG